MSLAQEMLAKAGVKTETENQPAKTGSETGAANNSEAAGEEKQPGQGEENKTGAAAQGAPAAQGEENKTEGGGEGGEEEAYDPAKDGTVTVKDLNPPTDTTQQQGQAGASGEGGAGAPSGDEDDIDDAKLLAALSKKTGKTITSLDEILKPASGATPTAEEEEKMKEKFHSDAIKFGLDKQLFDAKALETYNVDRAKSPREIAIRVFTQEQLASDPVLAKQWEEDKEAAAEVIGQRFEDAFAEQEEETDWRHIRGQALMRQIYDSYILTTHKKVLGATAAFEAEISTQQNAVGYKSKVDKVFAELPRHLKATIDGKEFSYQIPETSRNSVKEQFLSTDAFTRLGEGSIEEAELRSTVLTSLVQLEQPKFIAEVAKAYASQQVQSIQMGRKNVPVYNEQGATSQNGAPAKSGGSKARDILERTMAEKAKS